MALNLNLNKSLAIVGIVLGAIVSILILAAMLPSFFDATTAITENFTSASTGSAPADAILDVFAFIVPIVLIVGIVGLVILAAQFTRK